MSSAVLTPPIVNVYVDAPQAAVAFVTFAGSPGKPGHDANTGFSLFLPDRMPPPTQNVLRLIMPQPIDLSDFLADSGVAATSAVNMLIQRQPKGGVVQNIGSISWGAGALEPVVTFIPTHFDAGDVLVIPPVPVRDLTLGDIALGAS